MRMGYGWAVWGVAVVLAACGPGTLPPADSGAVEGGGMDAAAGLDAGADAVCLPCSDPRCRGCGGGCCLVFDDAAPPEAGPLEAGRDATPDATPPADATPVCPEGRSFCPGVGCVDLTRDPSNCNICGNVCGRSDPPDWADAGVRSVCLPADPDAGLPAGCRTGCVSVDQTLCVIEGAPRCLNLQTDPLNCGMCGRNCYAARYAECVRGSCCGGPSGIPCG